MISYYFLFFGLSTLHVESVQLASERKNFL